MSESAVTCLWLRVQEAAEGSTLDHCQQRFPTDTRDVAAVCRKLSERAKQVLGWPHRSSSTLPVSLTTPLSLTPFTSHSAHLIVYVCIWQDPSIKGIFHYSAKEQMTKYEMAMAIAQAFNLPSDHLIPVNFILSVS